MILTLNYLSYTLLQKNNLQCVVRFLYTDGFSPSQLKKEIMSRQRCSPRTLLELTTVFIAKRCGGVEEGLHHVASSLAALLPRGLLQRVCAVADLDSEDRFCLAFAANAPPIWSFGNGRITFHPRQWSPSEEAAYRTEICNSEVDRYLAMQSEK